MASLWTKLLKICSVFMRIFPWILGGMVTLLILFLILLYSGMMVPHFRDIQGVGVSLGAGYDRLIAARGEPHAREVITRENAGDLYALHYDGITFVINSGFGVIYFDITSERYRLGGRNRISVGSSRREVERDFTHRWQMARFWLEFPGNIYGEFHDSPGAEFGYFTSRNWERVEFWFDENDRVTKMRIMFHI